MEIIKQLFRELSRRHRYEVLGYAVLAAWGMLCSCGLLASMADWGGIITLTGVVAFAILACRILTRIFNLRRMELGITACQISILLALGAWVVGFMMLFNAKDHPKLAIACGILGGTLGWIFRDMLTGIVAFIHLRINHLLKIGDWIQIPKHQVDGEVKSVTLTMVTIYNWDTTTSSIPTSVLYTEHFVNLRNMMDGKTFGRRMCDTYVFDTGWFHQVSADEARKLQASEDIVRFLPAKEIKEGMTNAQLFRLYLFQWLMEHPHVSQQPRLIVRWMEQQEIGLPLQVYAFIIDSSLPAFEWQRSQIIEHIMESLEWFGLRLYQSPSAYDVSNGNIYLTDQAATYRKE